MLIDLTLRIDMNDPVVGKANMDQHSFMSAGHIGTHLDTYLQTAIPTDFFRRRGRIFDASGCGGADVGLSVLGGQAVEQGDFAIFHTGYLERHGYGTREYFRDHPQLSWELIDHLIDSGVSFIGIDAAGVRRGDEHGQADRRTEDKGAYIIENLNATGRLLGSSGTHPFQVFTGWTGLAGFSGLSCRVIAEVDGADGLKVRVLLGLLDELEEAPLNLPLPRDEHLNAMCNAIQAAPDEAHALSDWAQRLAMSERTLARHFQKETGMPFQAWKQRLRLLRSLSLLKDGRSVTAIALELGYSSASAYIFAFRKMFGVPPSGFWEKSG